MLFDRWLKKKKLRLRYCANSEYFIYADIFWLTSIDRRSWYAFVNKSQVGSSVVSGESAEVTIK